MGFRSGHKGWRAGARGALYFAFGEAKLVIGLMASGNIFLAVASVAGEESRAACQRFQS